MLLGCSEIWKASPASSASKPVLWWPVGRCSFPAVQGKAKPGFWTPGKCCCCCWAPPARRAPVPSGLRAASRAKEFCLSMGNCRHLRALPGTSGTLSLGTAAGLMADSERQLGSAALGWRQSQRRRGWHSPGAALALQVALRVALQVARTSPTEQPGLGTSRIPTKLSADFGVWEQQSLTLNPGQGLGQDWSSAVTQGSAVL